MEEDYWSKTQHELQPFFQTPELSEKLLRRPPFRFIHDIVCQLQIHYQCFGMTFSQEDYDANLIDTKEKKVDFLQKLINQMSVVLGRPIDVSAKKIVAGQECEKTNAMLQDLALYVRFVVQANSAAGGSAPPPPPPPPPPPHHEEFVPPPPPPPPVQPQQFESGHHASRPPPLFGDAGDLQRRHDPQREAEKARVIQNANTFNGKIANYGLDLSSSLTGSTISAQIRDMERQLKGKKDLATEAPNYPPEKLEQMIQRQIEAINQIKTLVAENHGIVEELVSATMAGI